MTCNHHSSTSNYELCISGIIPHGKNTCRTLPGNFRFGFLFSIYPIIISFVCAPDLIAIRVLYKLGSTVLYSVGICISDS